MLRKCCPKKGTKCNKSVFCSIPSLPLLFKVFCTRKVFLKITLQFFLLVIHHTGATNVILLDFSKWNYLCTHAIKIAQLSMIAEVYAPTRVSLLKRLLIVSLFTPLNIEDLYKNIVNVTSFFYLTENAFFSPLIINKNIRMKIEYYRLKTILLIPF